MNSLIRLDLLDISWSTTHLIQDGTERSGPGCLLSWGASIWQQDCHVSHGGKRQTYKPVFAEKVWSRSFWCVLFQVYSTLSASVRRNTDKLTIQVAPTYAGKVRRIVFGIKTDLHSFDYLRTARQIKIPLTDLKKCFQNYRKQEIGQTAKIASVYPGYSNGAFIK